MVKWKTMSYTRLFESLSKATRHDNPWEYFTFGQSLSPQQIEEIANANINRDGVLHDGTRSGYKEGVEKQNHKLREYITKENADKYPALTEFIKELQSKPIREIIAKMVGNKEEFKGSYVRLEVLNDTKGFYLKPHCDIPEKLISSLIYINQTGENVNLGTDLYNEDLALIDTVPFWHNYGYIFHGPNKWHGMEEGKEIQVERRGIQLNYVTFKTDWPVH
jgi:predicted house-cleaning noncanonical NTP pyrophosphatase (MazG superfamily)